MPPDPQPLHLQGTALARYDPYYGWRRAPWCRVEATLDDGKPWSSGDVDCHMAEVIAHGFGIGEEQAKAHEMPWPVSPVKGRWVRSAKVVLLPGLLPGRLDG